jgi:CIC family chloride channel protein
LPLAELRAQVPLGSAKWLFAVDRQGHYAGMIDVASAHDPELLDLTESLVAADLVSGHQSFVLPDNDIRTILRVFTKARAETLPVVRSREDRQVIGSVSEAFCLKRYAQELERRRHDELGMPQV